MIRRVLYFCLICQLFNLNDAEPLKGEHVWSALPHEFPFIASLGVKNPTVSIARSHFCGGSLITRIHVLTAAHCLHKYPKERVNVIIGEEDLSTARFRYEVHWWKKYNNWAQEMQKPQEFPKNDVAVVKLTTSVDRSDVIPVTLTPLNDQQLYRKKAVIAGWGITNKGNITDYLQRANVEILPRQMCMKRIKMITNKSVFPGKNYLCSAAYPHVLTTSGDSGGPVLDENKVLVGVVRGTCPNITLQWGNFPQEFINKYKVNCHSSVDYYRGFIENVTDLSTRPRGFVSFPVLLDL